jgi:hypothetical protein
MSSRPELNDLVQLAFKMDRDFFDSWRLDLHAQNRSEAGLGKLRAFFGNGIRGVNHLSPHWECHYVNAKLAGLPYVLQGMLLATVGIARDRQRDHWWDNAHNREKLGGARLATLAALSVEAHPIGHGTTELEQAIDSPRVNRRGIELQVIRQE